MLAPQPSSHPYNGHLLLESGALSMIFVRARALETFRQAVSTELARIALRRALALVSFYVPSECRRKNAVIPMICIRERLVRLGLDDNRFRSLLPAWPPLPALPPRSAWAGEDVPAIRRHRGCLYLGQQG
jgi:hypothetical protein